MAKKKSKKVSKKGTEMANTDVSNKNTSFFAALETANKEASETQPQDVVSQTSGAMQVTKEMVQKVANRELSGVAIPNVGEINNFSGGNTIATTTSMPINLNKVSDTVVPKKKVENSCCMELNTEDIKCFLEYLQDRDLIEVQEEFSVSEKYNEFKNNFMIKDPEVDPDVTMDDEVEYYAQQVADLVVSYNPNFSSVETLGEYYNHDFMRVLNNEFDNAMRACIELNVPQELEDEVIDKALDIIAGELTQEESMALEIIPDDGDVYDEYYTTTEELV